MSHGLIVGGLDDVIKSHCSSTTYCATTLQPKSAISLLTCSNLVQGLASLWGESTQ
jgi:hypothetical protein